MAFQSASERLVLLGLGRVVVQELVGNAADVRVVDEVGRAGAGRQVAERRRSEVGAVREVLREDGVRAVGGADVRLRAVGVLARAIGDGELREPVQVARDGVLRVEPELQLHLDVADVGLALRRRGRVVVLAGGAHGVAAGAVRVAARALRGRGARSARARALEGRGALLVHVVAGHAGAVEGPHVDRGVVLVGEVDDGQQRVGPEEVGALLEHLGVDARERRVAPGDGDALVRVRLDEEAVPALELRLDAAAPLAHGADDLLEVLHELLRVGERGRAGRRRAAGVVGRRREVGEEALGRVGDAAAVDELRVVVPLVGRRLAGRLGAHVAPHRAERRRDDRDVQVVDRRELEVPRRARAVARDADHGARGGVVDAVGRNQAREQVRHGRGEEGLLVPHRLGVIDEKEQVHALDGALVDRRREDGLRDRAGVRDGPAEAADEDGTDDEAEHGAPPHQPTRLHGCQLLWRHSRRGTSRDARSPSDGRPRPRPSRARERTPGRHAEEGGTTEESRGGWSLALQRAQRAQHPLPPLWRPLLRRGALAFSPGPSPASRVSRRRRGRGAWGAWIRGCAWR